MIKLKMTCSSYDRIVENPRHSDEDRRKALVHLVENGCLRSLFIHASSFSRIQWIRNFALLALIKFAMLRPNTNYVIVEGHKIILKDGLNLNAKRLEAARYLFVFLNDKRRPRKMRISALLGLIKGKHSEYCNELLNDPSAERWIKIKIKENM